MRLSHRLLAIALLAALALASGASPASAASSTSVVPAAWDGVDMTLVLDEEPPVLMVAATLPASATLPAQGQLWAPVAAQPQWLGQILGGDASADPSLDTTITKQGSYSVYAFTLTKSRTVQLETLLSTAKIVEGDNIRVSITWPAPQDAARVRLSFRIPKSAKMVKTAQGATLVTTDATANYYTATYTNVKAGKPVTLTMTYNVPSLIDGSGGPRRSTVTMILVGALALAVAVLAVILFRSRRAISIAPMGEEGEEAAEGADADDAGGAFAGDDTAAAGEDVLDTAWSEEETPGSE